MAVVACKAGVGSKNGENTGCFYCPQEASKIQSAGCDLQCRSPEPIHSTSPSLQLTPSQTGWGCSLHNEERGNVHKRTEYSPFFLFDFCAA